MYWYEMNNWSGEYDRRSWTTTSGSCKMVGSEELGVSVVNDSGRGNAVIAQRVITRLVRKIFSCEEILYLFASGDNFRGNWGKSFE